MAREIDVFNLSFIDLLSCGLGGVLLLLLLFATVTRNNIARDATAEDEAGGNVTDRRLAEGEEIPPPEPLVVLTETARNSKLPLQFAAFPPVFKNNVLHRQSDLQLADNVAAWMTLPLPELMLTDQFMLTEQRPIVFENGVRYRGLFGRRANERAGVEITMLCPNRRSMLADRHDNYQEGDRWKNHLQHWVFAVTYPNKLTPGQEELQQRLIEERRESLKLMVVLQRFPVQQPGSGTPVELDTLDGLYNTLRSGSNFDEFVESAVQQKHSAPVNVEKRGVLVYRIMDRTGDVFDYALSKEYLAVPDSLRKQTETVVELCFDELLTPLSQASPQPTPTPDPKAVPYAEAAVSIYQDVLSKIDEENQRIKGSKVSWRTDVRGLLQQLLQASAASATPPAAPSTFSQHQHIRGFLNALEDLGDAFAGAAVDGKEQLSVRLSVQAPPLMDVPFKPYVLPPGKQVLEPASRRLEQGATLFFVHKDGI